MALNNRSTNGIDPLFLTNMRVDAWFISPFSHAPAIAAFSR